MSYAMTLVINGTDLSVPVLPSELEISSPGKNEKTVILELGEVVLLRKKGLRTIKWESFFPANTGSYTAASIPTPIEAVRRIQEARDSMKPIRLILTGADLDINMEVGVNSFDYQERFGELGDIYYSIELTEYKQHGPVALKIQSATATFNAARPLFEEEPPRTGEPPVQSNYTVVAGDSLWAIAQRVYGNGGRYPEIYAVNQELIDARNRGTGNSKYTIYPGQVFVVM